MKSVIRNKKVLYSIIAVLVVVVIGSIGIHILHAHQVNRVLPGRVYQIATSDDATSGHWQKKQYLVFGKDSKEGHVDFISAKWTAKYVHDGSEPFDEYAAPGYWTYTANKNSLTIYANPTNGKRYLVFELTEGKVKGGTITGRVKWIDNSTGYYSRSDVKLTKIY